LQVYAGLRSRICINEKTYDLQPDTSIDFWICLVYFIYAGTVVSRYALIGWWSYVLIAAPLWLLPLLEVWKARWRQSVSAK
jgi:hypothetical protein